VLLFQFGGKLPQFVRAARDQNQVVSFPREDARQFQSDAERGASNKSGFAVSHKITTQLLALNTPAVSD
jgi:hypothetical protein